jgi:hypothetical protein
VKTSRHRNPVRVALNALYIALVAYTAFVLLSGAWRGASAHREEGDSQATESASIQDPAVR